MDIHEERMQSLRQQLSLKAAILITSPENRRYFSGFEAHDTQLDESSGALLISRDKQWLFTDSRYTEIAEKEAPLFTVINYKNGLAAEIEKLKAHFDLIYVEPEYLTIAALTRLRKSKAKFKPVPFSVNAFRAVKSSFEINFVKKALAITEKALGLLLKNMAPGQTEAECALFLETEFKRLGADGPSFATIVAAGPNGALPHAVPGGRKLKNGETVIVDCGAKYKGYCADITRTKILGEPKSWQKEIYSIVREAQLRSIAAIGPGVLAKDVDALARDYISEKGYGEYFGHGLGHGVGLAIHEAPSLSPRNPNPLQVGEIVTVEPGIYLPGKGGVRLEQLVLVTEDGHELLNKNKDFYDFGKI